MGISRLDFVATFAKTASDYKYTDGLTDSDWAWEFLRRNLDYRHACYKNRARPTRGVRHHSGIKIYREHGISSKSRAWGLSTFADPDLNAIQTDIFWTQAALTHRVTAASLCVQTTTATSDLDLFRDQNCCAILCAPGRQKLIIRSSNAAIDMELVGVNILFQPAQLQFQLDGFSSVTHGTKALVWAQNALKLIHTGDKKPLTKTTKLHRKKCLIALDCAQFGASLRDTAYVFRALGLTRLSWSANGDEALKKQVWRCRNTGLKFMQGRYRNLL